ncbi:MAG: PQQ-binding-like beta-propeller repeat protein [Treponema sp.]|nr:PQQ-binding-like beta-propeller repeat protein [Treponema sp.]
MPSILFNCVFLFITVIQAFSQNGGQPPTEPYWRQALGGEVLSIPSYQAQSAVVALDGGNIRAYSTTGVPMWNYFSGGRISPYVTRSREGTSYLSRTNGTLIAVNRAGRELWRRGLDAPLSSGIIAGWDGRIFAPTNRKIYCYTASGNLLWSKTLDSDFQIAPEADREGGIIFSLADNNVYRVDPFGNAQIWRVSNVPSVIISIKSNNSARQNIIVLFADGSMQEIGNSDDWFLAASSAAQSSALPRLPASPLAAAQRDDKMAVVMNDGRTSLISMTEKRIIWTGDSHILEIINSGGSPALEAKVQYDERGIYVLNKNGATGFTHDGRRLWLTYLNNAAAQPAFGNDGVLYMGGMDWILYAYKIEDRILPERYDIYETAAEGSYGLGRPRILDNFDFPVTENETRTRLEQINEAITTGTVGANEPAWTSFLMMVSAGRHPLQFRIGALSMLGRLGSQETIPWLINIFRNDNEPAIKTAAINAIGSIGVDPQGIALQAFLYSIINSSIRDEQILTAVASATGALCRFSGPPLSEVGIRMLSLLTANHQPPAARRQARAELSTLR